jgi:hypothetical protein
MRVARTGVRLPIRRTRRRRNIAARAWADPFSALLHAAGRARCFSTFPRIRRLAADGQRTEPKQHASSQVHGSPRFVASARGYITPLRAQVNAYQCWRSPPEIAKSQVIYGLDAVPDPL